MTKCSICGNEFNGNGVLCPGCRANCFGGVRKGNKMHAIKTKVDGHTFDSRLEARRYGYLKMLERAGEIKNLQLQVPYELIPKSEGQRATRYVADFVYETRNGEKVVEDVKSPISRTPVYKLKKRLMKERYGIIIKEVEKDEF